MPHTLLVKGVSPEFVRRPILVNFFRGATMGDPILATANVTLRCDGKAIRAFNAILLGQLSGGVTLVLCTMLLADVNRWEKVTPTGVVGRVWLGKLEKSTFNII